MLRRVKHKFPLFWGVYLHTGHLRRKEESCIMILCRIYPADILRVVMRLVGVKRTRFFHFIFCEVAKL